jgi:hypothetical protein
MRDKNDHEQPIPRTHNLEELPQLCLTLAALPVTDMDLTELTPYAVELRYDFEFWPDGETTAQAVNVAEGVRVAVLAIVPRRLSHEDAVLPPAQPCR